VSVKKSKRERRERESERERQRQRDREKEREGEREGEGGTTKEDVRFKVIYSVKSNQINIRLIGKIPQLTQTQKWFTYPNAT